MEWIEFDIPQAKLFQLRKIIDKLLIMKMMIVAALF